MYRTNGGKFLIGSPHGTTEKLQEQTLLIVIIKKSKLWKNMNMNNWYAYSTTIKRLYKYSIIFNKCQSFLLIRNKTTHQW